MGKLRSNKKLFRAIIVEQIEVHALRVRPLHECDVRFPVIGTHQLGALRAGLQADLVVLGDNAAVNISAVRQVERVMVAGRWIDVGRYRGY